MLKLSRDQLQSIRLSMNSDLARHKQALEANIPSMRRLAFNSVTTLVSTLRSQ